MKSRTIDIWEQTVKNPPKDYQEYFVAEKNFLKQNIAKDSIVLDVGSGAGRTMKELAPFVKEVMGIDNDPEAIEISERNLKNINNTKVYLEDIEKTHFKEQTFDIIFIGLTFVNFGESKFKVLSEIKRILKDNGKFVFSVFNENALYSREETYQHYEGGYTVLDREKGIVKFNKDNAISEQFCKDEIKSILNKAGFKINDSVSGKMFHIFSFSKN